MLLIDNGEPNSYDEAMSMKDSVLWKSSMKNEMDSLMLNQTWDLVKLLKSKKVLHNKWVFRVKREHDRNKRHEVRLVIKGFQQKTGIDYIEIFSQVVKLTTIKLVLKLGVVKNLHLEQLEIKIAFFHGDLEEEIYIQHPQGFRIAVKVNLVCQLKRSLHGLKQAPK